MAQQIYNRFKAAGKPLGDGEIAIVDAAKDHHYQVRLMVPSFEFLIQFCPLAVAWMVRSAVLDSSNSSLPHRDASSGRLLVLVSSRSPTSIGRWPVLCRRTSHSFLRM